MNHHLKFFLQIEEIAQDVGNEIEDLVLEIPFQQELSKAESDDKLVTKMESVKIVETIDSTPVERYSPPTPKEKKSLYLF